METHSELLRRSYSSSVLELEVIVGISQEAIETLLSLRLNLLSIADGMPTVAVLPLARQVVCHLRRVILKHRSRSKRLSHRLIQGVFSRIIHRTNLLRIHLLVLWRREL